jgi:hypothetical protein
MFRVYLLMRSPVKRRVAATTPEARMRLAILEDGDVYGVLPTFPSQVRDAGVTADSCRAPDRPSSLYHPIDFQSLATAA